MTKQTVLFIAEELPLPHHSGYSTYNHAFLTALLADGYRVHLLISGNRFPAACFNALQLLGLRDLTLHIPQAVGLPGGWYATKPLGLLKVLYRKFGGAFPLLANWLRRPARAAKPVIIGRWLQQHDLATLSPILHKLAPRLIFVDTLFRSPLLAHLHSRPATFLIGHDVFSLRCQSMADSGFQPCPWISAETEAAVLRKFDAVIAITESDAGAYRRLQPDCRVATLPSPVTPIATRGDSGDSGRIFYLGSQAHHNVDGLLWFLEQVWPLVQQHNPKLWLDVVGSIGSSINGHYPNVVLHGRLDDFTRLAERAMFAINPVRAGSGMKIKILDYLAHGLACITTTVGVAGFPEQTDRPMAVCDEAETFANTILDWAGNPAHCNRLSRQALAYVGQFSGGEFSAGLRQLIADTMPAIEPNP